MTGTEWTTWANHGVCPNMAACQGAPLEGWRTAVEALAIESRTGEEDDVVMQEIFGIGQVSTVDVHVQDVEAAALGMLGYLGLPLLNQVWRAHDDGAGRDHDLARMGAWLGLAWVSLGRRLHNVSAGMLPSLFDTLRVMFTRFTAEGVEVLLPRGSMLRCGCRCHFHEAADLWTRRGPGGMQALGRDFRVVVFCGEDDRKADECFPASPRQPTRYNGTETGEETNPRPIVSARMPPRHAGKSVLSNDSCLFWVL